MLYFLDFAGGGKSPPHERLDLRGAAIEVGRANASISALKHLSVSRQHALLVYGSNGVWTIANLTQSNHLSVNDTLIGDRPVALAPGDVVQFGGVKAIYRLDVEATIPASLPRLAESGLQLRPSAEFAERLSKAEAAIDEVRDRLEKNEALDESTSATLIQIAAELRSSGDRFGQLTKQIKSSTGLAFGAIAVSLLTATAVGVIRDIDKTDNFLRALYHQVGSPEGAAQILVAGGSAFVAWNRRDRQGQLYQPSFSGDFDTDMETSNYAQGQAPDPTRHPDAGGYPLSRARFSDGGEGGDRSGR